MQHAKSFLSHCRRFMLVVLAMSFPAAISAQESLNEPRFYLERLLEYYQGIETISAEFTVASERVDNSGTVQKDDVLYTCRYYQKGDNFRQENRTSDWPQNSDLAVFKDGTSKRLLRFPKDPSYLMIDSRTGSGLPWLGNQLFFYGRQFVDFVLQKPDIVTLVEMGPPKRVDDGSRRLVEVAVDLVLAVQGQTGSLQLTFRVDPDRNFALAYMAKDSTEANTTNHSTYEARNFVDAGGGYFAPTEIVKTSASTENGEHLQEYQATAKVSTVEINAPLDDSLFELVPEPGTHVSDQIAGLSYVAGEHFDGMGEPLIPRDSQVEKTEQPPAAPPEHVTIPAPTPAATPDVSPTPVLLVAALVLLLFGGVVLWRLPRRKIEQP
ncbi:MAG TPA: hypothetical protein VMZ06_08435 [Candidatus Bathyarchaeia archaeon]|nr:hypothetical protein [Candidatus Bathyarchaeia archaeon]